jgi:YD repeat-containing protein
MIAIWQALEIRERSAAKHQAVHWDDQGSRTRHTSAISHRSQIAPRTTERRSAS